MKKTAFKLCLTLALLLLVEVLSVNLVAANPTPWVFFPSQPVTSKPAVNLQSPTQNQVLNSGNVWLNFSITKPKDWFTYGPGGTSENPLYLILGKLVSINYTIDDGEPHALLTNEEQTIDTAFPRRTFQFNTNLTLERGPHKIQVSYEADCYYLISNTYTAQNRTFLHVAGSTYPVNLSRVKMYGTTEPINFMIAPFIGAPENVVYNESSVPLSYILDNSTASWVGYSLDGQSNATLLGNTTLAGLSNGAHTITVYTNDSYGNVASSQTVNFNVDAPSTFPTAAIASVGVVVACAGILLYDRMRKRHRAV